MERIKHQIELPDYRNNPISPRLQVLIALRFYATGAFQIVLADLFGVSQKSVSRIILNVSIAIASLAAEEIKFPETREEMLAMNHAFFKIASMPSVIGVIDGKKKLITKIDCVSIIFFIFRNAYSYRKSWRRKCGAISQPQRFFFD